MGGLDRRQVLRLGALGALGVLAGCRGEDTAVDAPTEPVASPTTTPPATTDTGASTPEPSGTTPPSAAVATLPLVCRDAWGAREPSAGLTPHAIRQLTVHHSAAVASNPTQGPGHLRGFQGFHMDDRGWPDIAYHVAVDRAGVVYELRDWGTVGDTGTDYDPAGHFLLLLDGNFDEHEPSEEQLAAAARVLAWASDHFGVGLDTVSGHRDHASTACPGDALYARLDELQRRAADLRDAGSVTLQRHCGPDASDAVRAVEAGEVPPLLRS